MKIKVAEAYTNTPGGRYISDGKYSAEEFRLKFLSPLLKECLAKKEILVINLDDTYGYSAGFLEESFGGLVRMGYLYSDVLGMIKFESNESEELINQIQLYILEAGKRQVEELRRKKRL